MTENSSRCTESALLTNGDVFVTGGFNDTGYLDSSEIFRPRSGLWRLVHPDPVPRWASVVVTLNDGNVLVIDGYHGKYLKTSEIYSPLKNTWTRVASDPIPREKAITVLLSDGTVLVEGGLNPGGFTSVGEIYNPRTDKWTNLPTPNLPIP
ncbi:MAG: Kelch repeat-containing protein [Leptospirillum sp.]